MQDENQVQLPKKSMTKKIVTLVIVLLLAWGAFKWLDSQEMTMEDEIPTRSSNIPLGKSFVIYSKGPQEGGGTHINALMHDFTGPKEELVGHLKDMIKEVVAKNDNKIVIYFFDTEDTVERSTMPGTFADTYSSSAIGDHFVAIYTGDLGSATERFKIQLYPLSDSHSEFIQFNAVQQ